MKTTLAIALILHSLSFVGAFKEAPKAPPPVSFNLKRIPGVFVKVAAANAIVRRIAATVVPQETEEERKGDISLFLKQIQPAVAQCWPLVQLGVATALVLKGCLTLQQIGDTMGGALNNAGERIGSGLQNMSIAGHDIAGALNNAAGALNNAGERIGSGIHNISIAGWSQHRIAGALNNTGQNIASGLNNISVGNVTLWRWNKPNEKKEE